MSTSVEYLCYELRAHIVPQDSSETVEMVRRRLFCAGISEGITQTEEGHVFTLRTERMTPFDEKEKSNFVADALVSLNRQLRRIGLGLIDATLEEI